MESPGFVLEGSGPACRSELRCGRNRYNELTTGVPSSGTVAREEARDQIHSHGGTERLRPIPATNRRTSVCRCLSELCRRFEGATVLRYLSAFCALRSFRDFPA